MTGAAVQFYVVDGKCYNAPRTTRQNYSERRDHAARASMESSESELGALRTVAERLGAGRQADIVLYQGEIAGPADLDLVTLCGHREERRQVLLVLSTFGGNVDAAYRVARCLQRHYRRFTLYVDDQCKGVGMLLALAADEIVLSDFGELGPLDIESGGESG